MKLAFLYAGQGSQHVGMGRDLYENYPAFRAVLDAAPVDFDLKQLCFEGPEEQLNDTRYTQPCMVAFAAGVTAVLKEEGITPAYTAGLSLGEYSALHCAGVLDAQTAVSLVAFRGKAMAEAVVGRPCGMAAVLNLDRDALKKACEEASDLGVVECTNFNCPGQIVISGDAAAVDKAGELAKAAGAKRVLPLKVSGPFHTSLMAPPGTPCGRSSRVWTSMTWRSPSSSTAWAGRWGRGTPSPPCWSGRSSPACTWRTPSAVWPTWVWTPWWRSARARPCPASCARRPNRSSAIRWRRPRSFRPPSPP